MNNRPGAAKWLGVLTIAMIAGCSETGFQEATGKGAVSGVHAVAGHGSVSFQIEEVSLGSIDYKSSTATTRYDDLSYVFNFDLPRPAATTLRLASQALDVVADTDYQFVLAGTPGNEEIFLWQRAEREWSEGETVFDLYVGHASTTLDAVDVYVAPEGTMPVAGNQVATVSYGERADAVEIEAGVYEITVTPQNDPATILYQGTPVTIAGAQSYSIIVLDGDAGITAPAALRLINEAGTGIEVPDSRFAPTVQFINASLDSGDIDIVFDDDFANPAVAALGFGEVSADVEPPATTANYQYAPAGITTPLLEEESAVSPGSRSLFVFVGDTGEEATIPLASIRRGYATASRLRLINALTNTSPVDIYLVESGTDINDVGANFFGVGFGFTTLTDRAADDYELIVTANGEKTPIAGPTALTLANDDVVEVVILDTVDPNTAGFLIFSNVNP